jgi:hypothetical protein
MYHEHELMSVDGAATLAVRAAISPVRELASSLGACDPQVRAAYTLTRT